MAFLAPLRFTGVLSIPQEIVDLFSHPAINAGEIGKLVAELQPGRLLIVLKLPCNDNDADENYIPVRTFNFQRLFRGCLRIKADIELRLSKALVVLYPNPIAEIEVDHDVVPLPRMTITVVSNGAIPPIYDPRSACCVYYTNAQFQVFSITEVAVDEIQDVDMEDVIPNTQSDMDDSDSTNNQIVPMSVASNSSEMFSDDCDVPNIHEGEYTRKRLRFASSNSSSSEQESEGPSIIDERDGDNILIVDETDLDESDSCEDQRKF